MNIWLIADTHFGHKEMTALADRPPGFENRITKHWINMVQDADFVIHLGDVFWNAVPHWQTVFSSLPGRKMLVVGNHDKKTLHWYMNNGFEFACHSFTWHIYGKSILFSHEPAPFFDEDLNIHGHLHTDVYRGFLLTNTSSLEWSARTIN